MIAPIGRVFEDGVESLPGVRHFDDEMPGMDEAPPETGEQRPRLDSVLQNMEQRDHLDRIGASSSALTHRHPRAR